MRSPLGLIVPSSSMLRLPRLYARSFSSLRSERAVGPRVTRARPVRRAIPTNFTKASSALLQSSTPPTGPTPCHNSLLSPVHIPEDPGTLITLRHPAVNILNNSALIVQRQLELGNILLGFEQANKYVIMDPNGEHVGFMAEEESGIGRIAARQWFRTHRSFTCHVFDKHQNEVLRFQRPFSWINSRIRVLDPVNPNVSPEAPVQQLAASQYRVIGEAQQQWHLLRRKYNLFLYSDKHFEGALLDKLPEIRGRDGVFSQFAYIDEPFLSWDFSLLTEKNELVGSVNRNFAGFGREIFTDTGVYALRMDAAAVAAEPQHLISNSHQERSYRAAAGTSPALQEAAHEPKGVGEVAAGRGMSLDERAVMLAAAVSVDFDYFSRHSSGAGGWMPFGVFGGEHNAGNAPPGPNVTGGGMADGATAGMAGGAMGSMVGDRGVDGLPQQQPSSSGQDLQQPEREADDLSPPAQGTGNEPGDGDGDGWWPFDD